MLTRRQARLLGLTTSDEGQRGTTRGGEDGSHDRATTAASHTGAAAAGYGDDGVALSSGGSSSGVPGSFSTAAAPSGTSIVLRLSASTAGRSGGTQLFSSSSSPFTSTSAASPVAGLELYGAVGGRGSRIGVRQVEAMLSSAQAAVAHWSASGTTAGPVIQLTSALPSSSPSSSLYTHPTRRLLPFSASGAVQPGPSRLSDSPVSLASGSRGEEREEDSRDREVIRVAPRQRSAPSLLPSSSSTPSALAAAVPTTAATVTRLSAAQLRSRWRGVVRNCTTLHVPAKARHGGVSSSSLSLAASLSSSSRANVKGDASVSPDVVSMERTHHVLHLTSASAERGDGITAGVMSSSSSNNSNGSSSVHASENAMGTPVAVLQHPHGIHRDMTASPVVSSRRSTTFFISPYQSDAAHPLTAAASKSVSSSSPADGAAPLPLQPGVAAGGKLSASRRPLMTAWALRQHKAAKASAWQRRLVHEVYNHVYVKAHEARMRLLFGLPDSSAANTRAESSGPQCSDGVMHGEASLSTSSPGNAEVTDAIAAGEAAYMQSLNPARSEEEARVLQVIASIDAALKQQIASAYHHSLAGANSGSSDRSNGMNSRSGDDQGDGSGQAGSRLALRPDESNRHHRLVVAATELPSPPLQPALSRSADSAAATTTTCTAATDAHAAARFSERRPAILEAVIASTTQRVEAFTDQLLPYQQEGVRWLLRLNTLEHMNGILADDMGLGKTAQTVVYLSCYKDMVEAEVQRPLMVLRQRLSQHCQRVLNVTTCSSASPTGSSNGGSGGSADEGGGELPPWLEWWAMAAESEGLDAEADGRASDSDGGTGVAPAPQRFTAGPFAGGAGGAQLPLPLVLSTDPAANAQLRAAESCGQTLRLVKEVKRWVWQLDDTQNGNDGSDDGGEAGKGRGRGQLLRAAPHSPSEVASPSSPLSPAGEPYGALEQSRETVSMGAAVRVLSASVTASTEAPLVVRKRRGRPPKHLSAMLASTAVVSSRASGRRSGDEMQQAAGRDAASTGPSRSSATASPAPAPASSVSVTLPALMERHSALATCSAALNARLDGSCGRFRPVLVIAPLSTLPHWADEFGRFSRRRSGGGNGNGGAADRDVSQRSAGAATGGASKSAMAASKATPAAEEGHAASAGERFTVYVLNGPRAEREDRMRAFLADVQSLEESPLLLSRCGLPSPVLVIPHDMLTKPLSGPLRQISRVRWHVVVIDEAQRIKSAQSTLYKKVRLLSSISRLVLTGTPLQNNTTELFSLLQFLSPQSFSNTAGSLFERLDSALMAASRSTALQDRELHILLCRRVHRLLMPFILRREKSILKASLPPMRDYAVLCPLMPYQETQLAEVRRRHEEGTLSGNPHIQSRKILLHPYTTQSFFYVDEQVVQTSGKLLVLDFMMRFLQRTRHKFLIFCGWTLVLDVVETLCGMRHIPFVRLDGRTPVEKRESNIRGFNRPAQGADAEGAPEQQLTSRRGTPRRSERGDDAMDDDADAAPAPCCFLISKVAGGVGLNLQAADTVFLLDVDYNPQRDAQALSRVYRVGQTREVRVFRLVIDHPIERDVVAIHEAKENLGRAVVQAGRYDLHSSVREREEALQHIFRAGTLSQLSQQWTAASPRSAAAAVTEAEEDEDEGEEEEATAATTGDDEYASSPSPIVGSEADDDEQVMDDEEGEREKYDGCDRRGLCREDDEGNSSSPSSPSPSETPTKLQRILLRVSDPVPSALKKPKTETFPIKKEEGVEGGDAAHVNGHDLLHSSAAPLPFPSGPSALPSPPSLSSSVLLTSQSTPSLRRKRRHISFKLEGEKESEDGEEEGGDGKRSKESSSSSGSMNGHRAGSLDDRQVSLTNGTIYSADAALPADSSDPSAAAAQPVELSPAAHLLAMRERLEEVLLRHDGERVVLHDMFRTLEASLARTG